MMVIASSDQIARTHTVQVYFTGRGGESVTTCWIEGADRATNLRHAAAAFDDLARSLRATADSREVVEARARNRERTKQGRYED